MSLLSPETIEIDLWGDLEVPLGKELITSVVSARLIETADNDEELRILRVAMGEITEGALIEHRLRVLIHATFQASVIIRHLVGFIALANIAREDQTEVGLMVAGNVDADRYRQERLAVWRRYLDSERDPPQ